MKSFQIIHKHGKFYDASTKRRILLKEGAQVLLAADDDAFTHEDPLNKAFAESELLDNYAKQDAITSIPDLAAFHRCMFAGQHLDFYFTLSHTKAREQTMYMFRLMLQEDLYLIRKKGYKNQESADFASCKCVVHDCLSKNIDFFEPIFATSLNNALSKTIAFYFPNQRTAGGSVYLHMHIPELSMITLDVKRKEWLGLMERMPDVGGE